MRELIIQIKRELLKLRDTRKVCEEKLCSLPEGVLRADVKRGKSYYYQTLSGVEKYLGRREMELVEALKERKLAEEILKVVSANEECLECAIHTLRPFSPKEIYKTLPKSYRKEGDSNSGGITDGQAWADAPYVKKSSYGRYEDPSQLTLKGDYVRSKSELNIANMMYMKGIPYRYEEVTELCGEIIAPDFAVYRESDGKVLFLEHFGMMYNRKYRDDFAWKVHLYIKAGYMPYRDVFFTFEDLDGNIDTRFIDYLMETYFM